MVIDTSALVAIGLGESDAASIVLKLTQADRKFISAASYVEASMVLIGRDPKVLDLLDSMLSRLKISIEPLTDADARLAREAFIRYGRGRSPAALNLGDLYSYALAKRMGEPLLFKGNDFAQTDIERA